MLSVYLSKDNCYCSVHEKMQTRLEIIMPDIFSIILFPNAHNVFLYISAIIPNLCSKNLINSITLSR